MSNHGHQRTRVITNDQIKRRRDFTQKLNLRRQVYRELTSYQVFPLQEMAMKDLDEKLNEYLVGGCESDDDTCDLNDRRAGTQLSSDSATAAAAATTNQALDLNLQSLREQYRQEFLSERLNSSKSSSCAPAAVVAAEDVSASQIVDHDTTCLVSDHADLSERQYDKQTDASGVLTKQLDEKTDVEKEQTQQIKGIESSEAQQNVSPCNNTSILSPQVHKNTPTKQQKLDQQEHLSILWSMEPRIFALETSGTGKRRYICSHLGRFMDHYWRECDVYNRHYYELIREGSPCRLYFDLEFNKLCNQDITQEVAEGVLTELFQEVQHEFEALYDITIQRHHLVDLDSSTSKKFSRHWIFHLPNNELFSDARAAGAFVKLLVARLDADKESGSLESRGHGLLAKYLLVNADGSTADDVKLTRFIDIGVYTRNRLFRMLGSSKFGKRPDAALRIANSNAFHFPDEFNNAKFFLPEMNVSDANSNDEDENEFEQFRKSHNWEGHAAALEHTLVVPAHISKHDYPILPDPESLLDDSQQKLVLEAGLQRRVGGGSGLGVLRPSNTHGKSPFPKLEDFIVTELGQRKGLVGSIGTYSLGVQEPLPRTISYNMLNNRWCENIGRAHKSNNIIWNVHLMNRVCYQSCHDPDCRGFRGKEMDLPQEVNTEIDEYFLDRELSSLPLKNQDNQESSEFDDPELEEAMKRIDVKTAEEFDDPLLEEAMKHLAL